jgi:hypothetical protein
LLFPRHDRFLTTSMTKVTDSDCEVSVARSLPARRVPARPLCSQ